MSLLRGGSLRENPIVCVCVWVGVLVYGNVWKPLSISLIVWQRAQAGVERLKRWAVPEKMYSCGGIEMHEG